MFRVAWFVPQRRNVRNQSRECKQYLNASFSDLKLIIPKGSRPSYQHYSSTNPVFIINNYVRREQQSAGYIFFPYCSTFDFLILIHVNDYTMLSLAWLTIIDSLYIALHVIRYPSLVNLLPEKNKNKISISILIYRILWKILKCLG